MIANIRLFDRARLTLITSFVMAFILSILPAPVWAEPFRPDWVGLVLIYWCIAAPNRVGVGVGWTVGLILDVLYGSLLGQHALAKTAIAYIALRLHLQIRMFPAWQQAGTVLLLLIINQILLLWVRGTIGEAPTTWKYWISSFIGMLIWPWLFVILRDLRRRGDVS